MAHEKMHEMSLEAAEEIVRRLCESVSGEAAPVDTNDLDTIYSVLVKGRSSLLVGLYEGVGKDVWVGVCQSPTLGLATASAHSPCEAARLLTEKVHSKSGAGIT